jgi:endoglucanase Acf2
MSDLSRLLHAAADETNDAHDHDELHAAAVIVGWPDDDWGAEEQYVRRWIDGLVARFLPDDDDRPRLSAFPE